MAAPLRLQGARKKGQNTIHRECRQYEMQHASPRLALLVRCDQAVAHIRAHWTVHHQVPQQDINMKYLYSNSLV